MSKYSNNGAFDRAKFYEACNTGKHIRKSISGERPPCSRIGTKRFNQDGTENWCSRNFPGTCPECGLNAYLD